MPLVREVFLLKVSFRIQHKLPSFNSSSKQHCEAVIEVEVLLFPYTLKQNTSNIIATLL